MSELVKWAEL